MEMQPFKHNVIHSTRSSSHSGSHNQNLSNGGYSKSFKWTKGSHALLHLSKSEGDSYKNPSKSNNNCKLIFKSRHFKEKRNGKDCHSEVQQNYSLNGENVCEAISTEGQEHAYFCKKEEIGIRRFLPKQTSLRISSMISLNSDLANINFSQYQQQPNAS